jgi:RHS repeat-associated protein
VEIGQSPAGGRTRLHREPGAEAIDRRVDRVGSPADPDRGGRAAGVGVRLDEGAGRPARVATEGVEGKARGRPAGRADRRQAIEAVVGGVGVAGDVAGLTAVSDAFRYDPYGELLASVTSATPSPWRYQGRLLENTGANTSELYDFGFRSYAPSLAAFTSLDDVSGSAQNPITLNRFLYAAANPETT